MSFSPPADDLTISELRDERVKAGADESLQEGPSEWPVAYADPFPHVRDSLIEVPRAELDVGVLGGSVQHHGALIVRGLLGSDDVDICVASLLAARDAQERHFGGTEADRGWFDPVQTNSKLDAALRKNNADMGVVWLADSPRATQVYLDALDRAQILQLLAEYFGEPALFSLQKSTMRVVEPEERLTTWHQDGAFMGADIRTMNLWVALSDCGGAIPASGMEMIPKRIDEILDTTDGIVPYAIPFDTVADITAVTGETNPEFRAGDAIFFDDRFVHRTSLGPGLSQTRLAVESWFFGATSVAKDYTCLLA